MEPESVPVVPEGGNTKTPSRINKNKMRISPAKKWCFTYNNYPENWMVLVVPKFEGLAHIIGEEVSSSGTPHLQGYVEFKKKIRPISLGMSHTIHWEIAKGDRAANIKYCSKDGKYTGSLKPPRPLPVVELYGWQLKAQEQFQGAQDNRSIYWWWEPDGGKGKSSFVRWAAMNGALVCAGKAADMKYLCVKYQEDNGNYPDVVIFDVPRSSFKYISYAGIEEIKNGVFASSKYECQMVVMPHPHVFVLANFEPNLGFEPDLSLDRFVINRIE